MPIEHFPASPFEPDVVHLFGLAIDDPTAAPGALLPSVYSVNSAPLSRFGGVRSLPASSTLVISMLARLRFWNVQVVVAPDAIVMFDSVPPDSDPLPLSHVAAVVALPIF